MRAFIQSLHGEPWNEECRIALIEYSRLDVECILFSSPEELNSITRKDIVVGGTLITRHVFEIFGIKTDNESYPRDLTQYLGRKVWRTQLSNIKGSELPLFVKPVYDKLSKGTIAEYISDLYVFNVFPDNTEVFCSEVVKFISEWRCFIVNGSVVGMRHYRGDKDIICDWSVIYSALAAYQNCPSGFAIDFGVTADGRTLLVEVNDGYALGAYGLSPELYCKLLTVRWRELMGIKQ